MLTQFLLNQVNHRAEDLKLVCEIEIKGADCHSGFVGDFVHGHRMKPSVAETCFSGPQQGFAFAHPSWSWAQVWKEQFNQTHEQT
jgi:hypothetical protein